MTVNRASSCALCGGCNAASGSSKVARKKKNVLAVAWMFLALQFMVFTWQAVGLWVDILL